MSDLAPGFRRSLGPFVRLGFRGFRSYLLWSIRQFYLLLFWPTRFHREVEAFLTGDRRRGFQRCLAYFWRMLPWIVALACLGNLIAGSLFRPPYVPQQVPFAWETSWVGVALGVGVGVALGAAIGVVLDTAVGVAVGVTFGVAFGMTLGMPVGLALGPQWNAQIALAYGVALGVTLGMALGVTVSVTEGFPAGLAAGLGGVPLGGAVGVAAGIQGGLAVGLWAGLAAGLAFAVAFSVTYFRLATYPLDVAAAAATYFVARWRPRAAARAWAWCPVVWNEVIWLPLPFVGHLLALLVREDREKGFDEIAFVAAHRQRQRRAAGVALVEVALDDLRTASVEGMVGVTDKLAWTTDAPLRLPADLVAALAAFDRVSQHVGQYFLLQSPFRREEALVRAHEDLRALQSSLIAGRGPLAPRLLQTANEWAGLLDAERDRLRPRLRERQEIPNPFVIGSPVTERQANVFAGRRDIVEQVEGCVLGARQALTILLHGPRRMGKTSILKQLPRLLGPDFAAALVDCQNPAVTGSRATLLRYLSRELSAGLRLRRVAVEPLSADALEREPFTVFHEWLDRVEAALPGKLRLLVCLDEYENLQRILDAGWGEEFLDALRHTLQHRPRFVLMFTGAHTFAEQGPAWTNRFLSARRVRVSFLTREEVMPLLTRPMPEFGLTYADGALDAIFHATNGQPFLTQVVAFQLVELLNAEHRQVAMPDDVERAIDLALVRNSEYFDSVWFDAGAEGQAVLLALARGETPPALPRGRAWLREHDVLNDQDAIAVPMVERWLKEKVAGVGDRADSTP